MQSYAALPDLDGDSAAIADLILGTDPRLEQPAGADDDQAG
jgi:hypothetical protein